MSAHDPINHPSHYTGFSNGAEVIDITENLSFNRGNAVKYLARAGRKDPARELEDLKKARWYVEREIARTERELADSEPAEVVIEKPTVTKIQVGDGPPLAYGRDYKLGERRGACEEPRTWYELREVPEDVQKVTDNSGSMYRRFKPGPRGWEVHAAGTMWSRDMDDDLSEWAPFTEVIADA